MPRGKRKLWRLALLAGVILSIAAGAAVTLQQRSSRRGETARYIVQRKDISHSLQIAGKIVPVTSTVITSRQSGRIVELAVQEGSQVKAGDLLFTMRLEAEGQTELLQKRAEVRRLELEVSSQSQRLNEKRPVRELLGAASVLKEENELEKLRLELTVARERLAVLERELGLSPAKEKGGKASQGLVFVTAPTAGIVTLIDKRPGDFVLGGAGSDATGTERMVMVVADMSALQVRTRVMESDLRYVKRDLPVRVRLDAYPEVDYLGKVTHIGGQGRVDNKAGYTYFEVDVSVEQQDERVLPEMNATIELIFAQKDDVLTLPVAAVAILPDHAFVRRPDDTAPLGYREHPVQVGIVNEENVEIVDGLAEGDAVLEIDFAALDLSGESRFKGVSSPRPATVKPSRT